MSPKITIGPPNFMLGETHPEGYKRMWVDSVDTGVSTEILFTHENSMVRENTKACVSSSGTLDEKT